MDMIGSAPNMPRHDYQVVEGVAIVDVCGFLCNDPCWWDETGYDEIQSELQIAAADSTVDGILLNINSPGGETDNAFETADVVRAVAATKPVWAVAGPMAYSAAYLLASQAAKIYTPPVTGGVGSIGVYALHLDYSAFLAKAGIKPTFISAGKGKTDGNPYEPLSAEAQAKLVLEIQRLYGEFVARVAAGRKMGESAIIKLGADCFEGSKAALGAGLADVAGTVESAWLDLAMSVANAKQAGNISASAGNIKPKGESMENNTPAATTPPAAAAAPGAVETVDLEKLKADAADGGYLQAAEVVELCTLAGKPALAAAFIREKKPVADVRSALLAARAEANDRPGETRSAVLPHHAANATEAAKSTKEIATEKARREGVIS